MARLRQNKAENRSRRSFLSHVGAFSAIMGVAGFSGTVAGRKRDDRNELESKIDQLQNKYGAISKIVPKEIAKGNSEKEKYLLKYYFADKKMTCVFTRVSDGEYRFKIRGEKYMIRKTESDTEEIEQDMEELEQRVAQSVAEERGI